MPIPYPPQCAIQSTCDLPCYLQTLADIERRFCPDTIMQNVDGPADYRDVEEWEMAKQAVKKWLFRRMQELETLDGREGANALERTANVLERIINRGHSKEQRKAPKEDGEIWTFQHATLKILEPKASETTCDSEIGNQVWNAGVVLAQLIDKSHIFQKPVPKHILELGCGTGLTSILAAKVLAPYTKIMATDFHPAICETATKNLALNDVSSYVDIQILDWSSVADGDAMHNIPASIDCVMAADVVYSPRHAVLLPTVIRRIAHHTSKSLQVIIVNRIRPQFMEAIETFELNMVKEGFLGDYFWVDDLVGQEWKGEKKKYRLYRYLDLV